LGALVARRSAEQRLDTRAQVVETRPARKIDAIRVEHVGHYGEVMRRKLRENAEHQLCVDPPPLIHQRERILSLRPASSGWATSRVIEVLGLHPHPARHLALELLVPRGDPALGELIPPGFLGVTE